MDDGSICEEGVKDKNKISYQNSKFYWSNPIPYTFLGYLHPNDPS